MVIKLYKKIKDKICKKFKCVYCNSTDFIKYKSLIKFDKHIYLENIPTKLCVNCKQRYASIKNISELITLINKIIDNTPINEEKTLYSKLFKSSCRWKLTSQINGLLFFKLK